MKISIQNLRSLEISISFVSTDSEDAKNIHGKLFERLSASSFLSLAKIDIEKVAASGLLSFVEALPKALPLITLKTKSFDISIRKEAIDIDFKLKRSVSTGKYAKISKKILEQSSHILSNVLLNLAGLTSISELELSIIADFAPKESIESIVHLLEKVRVSTAQKVGYALDMKQATLIFEEQKDDEKKKYEVSINPSRTIIGIPDDVDGPSFQCKVNLKTPLGSLDLFEQIVMIIEFSKDAIKLMGL